MAVYRQIQVSFWQDSFILKLTPEEKYFYLYLLTNSKTKQSGIYELPMQIIIIETGYNRETVIKLIQKFIDYNKIKYDWENEEIYIDNWIKHNPLRNPNIKKCVEKELKGVKNKGMIPLTSPLQAHLQKEKEKEEEKEEEKSDFSSLWISIYLRNPGLVELDFVKDLSEKFGHKKAKRILYDLRSNNFHSIQKMRDSLNWDTGEIKPKESNGTPLQLSKQEMTKLYEKDKSILSKYNYNNATEIYTLK